MNLVAKLGSRLLLLVCGRIGLLVLGLMATALLTRILGPAGFGSYRAAVAYLGLVVVLADLGLGSIFVRQISRAGADQSRIIGNALALRLSIAFTLFLIAVLLAHILPFDATERLGIFCGAAGFVAYSAHLMLFGLFQQKLRQQGAIVAEIGGGLILLGAIYLLARLGADPAYFVAALGGSYIVTFLVSLAFALRLVPFRLRFERAEWLKLARPALSLAGAGTLMVIYVRADTVLLAFFKTPEAVGLYGVPVKISDSLLGIALLFIGLVAPLMAKAARREQARFREILNGSLKAAFIGSIAVALGFAALADEIVWLLAGSSFAEGADILRLLTAFFVLHMTTLLLREACVALDIQGQLLPVYLVGAVVALLAYALFIPPFAGLGAAAALILAECCVFCGVLLILRRALRPPHAVKVPLVAILCGLLSAALMWALQTSGWGWFATTTAVLSAYFVLLFLSGALTLSMLQAVIAFATAKRNGT